MSSTNFHIKMDSFLEETEEFYAKCGEMFFTVKGNIAFHCTLCGETFKNFEVYNNHTLEAHLAPDLKAELLTDFGNEGEDTFNILSEEAYSTNCDEYQSIMTEKESKEEKEEEGGSPETFAQLEEREEIQIEILQEANQTDNYDITTIPKEGIRSYVRSVNRKPPKLENVKYECPYCDFTSTVKTYIRKHIARHSLNRPYECKECGKAFYTRTEVKVHMRMHTGERPYLCNLCGRSYTTAGKLGEHQKRHNNVRDKACALCPAAFITPNELAVHMAVHTVIRSYKCTFCHSTFKLDRVLQKHMKIHENKRSYKCKICDAKFNQNTGLYVHMKNIHSVVK